MRPLFLLVCLLGLSMASAQNVNSDLRVTDGAIKTTKTRGRLLVEAPEMRAVFQNDRTPAVVQITFTYLGVPKKVSHLANGEVRHQFGLKLHSQDPCNLVYVMWDFDQTWHLSVSVKSNPGMGKNQREDCGDGGYHGLTPTEFKHLPAMKVGDTHTLSVWQDGAHLEASVDGMVVWRGINDVDTSFHGPAGVRSDNVRIQFGISMRENR